MNSTAQHAIIIGGGPAGLMAAERLLMHGLRVDLYDAMPSLGRKFLLAGIGGLNLTHSEEKSLFIHRYGDKHMVVADWLNHFDNHALRAWAQQLGIPTFIGSSGKVFPEQMKAAPLLRAWLQRLREQGLVTHVRHKWLGFQDQGMQFASPEGEKIVQADAYLLALGGGSWPQLGSDGLWVDILKKQNIAVTPLQAANCGFDILWSSLFINRYAGHPLKNIVINGLRGEAVITQYGIEGGLIYAHSAQWRQQLAQQGAMTVGCDLLPDYSYSQLLHAIEQPRYSRTLSNHLRKQIGLNGAKLGLLYEYATKSALTSAEQLATLIKSIPLQLESPRPLAEAISSAGGVCFDALDSNLMLKSYPGIFCAGEMLDWEAPTGGYLLTACFASGFHAANGLLRFTDDLNPPNDLSLDP